MICRLLRRTALTVSLTVGLTACMQGGVSSDPALGNNGTDTKSNGSDKNHSILFRGHKATVSGKITIGGLIAPPNANQLTGTGGNLWDRLRTNFQLAPADNRPQVQAQINWFMHNQTYLAKTIKRAAPYMYLIFQETQSRNLPAELVLLPIMESAYNPFIRSSRGAVGLWQLMSTTANGFGVKQDFWYDGRRDVYASTNAALDYLTYLQSYFGGDWLLAIAAYDAGEGRLQGAVRRNAERGTSTDFWSLSLPVETQAYVPRLLALAAIISNPAKYNITLPPITDQPYLQQVDLGAPINLSQAAEMAEMSLPELKALNPGYSRTSTGPNGPYRLLLPIDKIPIFKEHLAALPAMTAKNNWGRYKVQRGDTLASIADRFATSVTALREANHLHGSAAPVGRVIMIPMSHMQQTTARLDDLNLEPKNSLTADNVVDQAADMAASQTPANATQDDSSADDNDSTDQDAVTEQTKVIAAKTYHTVKSGETLSMISRHYGVKVSELQRLNKLKANASLKPGMRLLITHTAAAKNEEISTEEVSTKSEKTKKEPITTTSSKTTTHKKTIKTVTNNNEPTTKVTHYTVRAGDNLIKIANRYNVKVANLRKWNHLAENAVVKPGQQLTIYTE